MTKLVKPRVAIDIHELANPKRAGKATVVYCILKELLARNLSWQPVLYSRVPIADLPLPPSAESRLIGGWPGWRALWLARDIERADAELAIFPTGFNITRFMRRPFLIIVYDMVAFSSYQQTLPAFTRLAERFGLPAAARRAAHILTISEFTKTELMRYLGIPADKITVFPLAADAAFGHRQTAAELAVLRARYELPEQFFLFVGTLEPRKNIARLLAAYRALPATLRAATPLVLAGQAGWLPEPLPMMVERLGLAGQVRHLAYVPFADLPALYQAATAFVYPSLYEGFGLPPLEAMTAGTPVVTSRVTSLPEVVGNAALLIDPEDTADLTRGLRTILEDASLRRRLVTVGRTQAAKFSWSTSADIVDQVIRQVLFERDPH